MMIHVKFALLLSFSLLCFGCANYGVHYSSTYNADPIQNTSKDPLSTIYLIGDAGKSSTDKDNPVLDAFQSLIKDSETKDDFLIYLGDNIYEKGFHEKDHSKRKKDEKTLNAQIYAAKNFQGKTFFIPGNHDWYSGLSGLKDQEEYIEKAVGKNSFLPEKGCPITTEEISDDLILLFIDTQWYIANWDQHPTINDNCSVKNRKDFFLELEGELKKHNGKTIVLSMHHPAFTFGPHGGNFGFEKHLFPFQSKFPLPGLGSILLQLRAQGGVITQDRYSAMYRELMDRIITLSTDNERLILASGHEHSLQYISVDGVKQIVSGSGSKVSAVGLGYGSKFSFGGLGFAKLVLFEDGSSEVSFYNASNGKPELIFHEVVHEPRKETMQNMYPVQFPSTIQATVYDPIFTQKGSGYEKFWGKHYRYSYGTGITVPVALLDTLLGGVTIDRKGGGHQTRSLRLVDPRGKNYSLRAMKKSAVQYLQSVAFVDQYVENDFTDTFTEDLILDFYTASHPFAALVIGDLSDAIGLYHTNPRILYVPKQDALGSYNDAFGDELYVLEERPDDGFLDSDSFGRPTTIESSSDIYKNLRKDEKYSVDEESFIRARLFDMLIGDWDRHQDQWRWSRFDISEDNKIYRPIPRDRDQAFSNYDGTLLDILKILMPPAGQLQKYDDDFSDIKWLNAAGIKLDRAFIQTASKETWLNAAKFIQEQITDEVIEIAFSKLPLELQDETLNQIKANLKNRRALLTDLALNYYNYFAKLVIITGTDKDDRFEIIRKDDQTEINVYRIYKDTSQGTIPYKTRIIHSEETKQVWIYGLDDDDHFTVTGDGKNPVFIRIIGGQNNDTYTIDNGKKVKIHDHRSKPNTFLAKSGASINLTDNYDINTYDPNKQIQVTNSIVPSIGFNPDDGMKLGFQDNLVIKGFKTSPISQRHIFNAGYFFATGGLDVSYKGEYFDALGTWNIETGVRLTSENFTQNFFGFGNETVNEDDREGLEYNRVRTSHIGGIFGIAREGQNGSRFAVSAELEQVEVENTINRFISNVFSNRPETFEHYLFGTLSTTYRFSGFDRKVEPTRGMDFTIHAGITANWNKTDNTFTFVKPSITFFNALTKDHKLVLKTMAQGQFNFGGDYEFYQSATLGSNTGLRGYRSERFQGERSLSIGGDLRYSFEKFKTGLLPVQIGVFVGADTGRVWVDRENSDIWHSDVGGGVWINAVDSISGEFSLFNSVEGMRFAFQLGVGF